MRFLWLSFGRWSYVNTNCDCFGVSKKRIYFNGYKWTPFIVVSIHRGRSPANQTVCPADCTRDGKEPEPKLKSETESEVPDPICFTGAGPHCRDCEVESICSKAGWGK